jgi:hypothetical protein
MGLMDSADDMAERAAFENGGYGGLLKYKMIMLYKKTTDVCYCA